MIYGAISSVKRLLGLMTAPSCALALAISPSSGHATESQDSKSVNPTETVSVSSPSQLLTVLKNVKGNTTILLRTGHYADLKLQSRHFRQHVTLRSADGRKGAVFRSISLYDVRGLRIEGVTVRRPRAADEPYWTKAFSVEGSDRIEISRSDISSSADGNFTNDTWGIFVRGSSKITVVGNSFHDLVVAGIFSETRNLILRDNTVKNTSLDAFDFANISTGLIENNFASNFHPSHGAHPDFIQFWTTNTVGSKDIIIRGNVLLQQGKFPVQGIFINDERSQIHRNFTIENNLIYNSSPHGISLYGAENSIIRNNTVLSKPGSMPGASGIKVFLNRKGGGGKVIVADNVAAMIGGKGLSRGVNRNNLIAQWADPLGPNFFGNLFLNPFSGARASDFLPLPDAAKTVAGRGATARISHLGQPPIYIASDVRDGTLQSLEPRFSALPFAAAHGSHFNTPSASLSYTWNFGDGTTSSGQTVTHRFATSGKYLIAATVTDGRTTYTSHRTIFVQNPYLLDMAFEGNLNNTAAAVRGGALWTGIPKYTQGKDGLAAAFGGHGRSEYVKVSGVSKLLSGMKQLTISFYFRVNSFTTRGRLLSLHTGYNVNLSQSQIAFQINTQGIKRNASLAYNDPKIVDRRWHRLVAIYDGVSGVVALYIDGTKVNEQTGFTGRINGGINHDLTIGGWPWGKNSFNGEIDNLVLVQGNLPPKELDAFVAIARKQARTLK